jgi:cyanophycinase
MFPALLVAAVLGATPTQPVGHLVIAGGGPTVPEVLQKALTLAGGKEAARVLIIPQASYRPDAGQASLRMWQRAGARQVTILDLRDRTAALKAVKDASLIWMPGGSQNRLMSALTEEKLVDAIRERFREGATVGGTSAGAAVMSQVMLTGLPRVQGVARTAEMVGLGLWPDVIVDQHFLRRNRSPRLLNAVLHHPEKPGIGIDEATAVVVEGRCFEVIGKSKVVVLDGRRAVKVAAQAAGSAAAKVATYVLEAGMKFDLDKGLLSR